MLTLERMHHPKSDVDRLYLPRNEGGRGLIQLETAYKVTTIGLDTYINAKNDPLLVFARQHEKQKKKYSVVNQAAAFRKELNLPETPQPENEAPTIQARKVKQKAKRHAQEQMKQKWEGKKCTGNTQKE